MDACFLVGCPRSGTTLLQAMLAQHPSVFTFPESHYFHKILGRWAGLEASRLVSPRAAARTLDSLASSLQVERPSIPRWWIGAGKYRQAFAPLVETAAGRAGRETWVEKSPIHLHHIETIVSAVTGTRVLHLLRDGRDVVASLVAACRDDPDRWVGQLLGGRRGSPDDDSITDAAVRRWNHDVGISLEYRDHPDHLLVDYARLIDDPPTSLSRVCRFLGLVDDPAMVRPWESAALVAGWRGSLPHMSGVFGRLEDRRLERFRSLFTASEQRAIVSRLRASGVPNIAQE